MDQTPIQLAIERMYSAFAVYPCPVTLDASPARDPVAMIRALTSAPLRELADDQLGPFAGSALYTVGGVADYKHFLPRILELAVSGFSGWIGCDPSIIAAHLIYARWLEWPAAEVDAVKSVFHCGWIDARDRNPFSECDASDWLCALAALGEELGELLADWLAAPTVNAILQAAWFILSAPTAIFGPRQHAAYWSYVDDGRRLEVANWMLSDAVASALTFARSSLAEEDRWSLDQALTVIRGPHQ